MDALHYTYITDWVEQGKAQPGCTGFEVFWNGDVFFCEFLFGGDAEEVLYLHNTHVLTVDIED